MTYLARLPRTGFTIKYWLKEFYNGVGWVRCIQIEPALSYSIDEAYKLYKSVERCKRATELERFIHAKRPIDTAKLATDMFRIRQLTSLDEIERNYSIYDNLKFSASILDNQEPFLRCSAICINSALVDLSESSRGDMFLVSEINLQFGMVNYRDEIMPLRQLITHRQELLKVSYMLG